MSRESIAQRRYEDESGSISFTLMKPYQEGGDWFCELHIEESGEAPQVRPIGGVDSVQAIRLALEIMDALVAARPNARSQGITGVF